MNVTLIKRHPSAQLAHLYEHLYLAQIKQLFYTNGLFKYVDMALLGITWDAGALIQVEVNLYTPAARALSPQLSLLSIDMNNDAITTALLQIMAEEDAEIYIKDKVKIRPELKKLQGKPWQSIDTFDSFDAKNVRTHAGPLYLTNTKASKPHQLITTISLEKNFLKKHRELIPLFRHVAKCINFTTQDQLSETHGFYNGEQSFARDKLTAELLLHRRNPIKINLKELLAEQQQIAAYMHENNAFEHLSIWLQNSSYANNPYNAPSSEDQYHDTHTYTGEKGWQRLATKQNIGLLLGHIVVKVRYGNMIEKSRLFPDMSAR